MKTRLAPFKSLAADWLAGPHASATTNQAGFLGQAQAPRRQPASMPLANFLW